MWFYATVTVTNGSKVVDIQGGIDTSIVKAGDALVVGNNAPVEIESVYSDEFRLVKAWAQSSQSGVDASVMPTSVDFSSAVTAMKNATAALNTANGS